MSPEIIGLQTDECRPPSVFYDRNPLIHVSLHSVSCNMEIVSEWMSELIAGFYSKLGFNSVISTSSRVILKLRMFLSLPLIIINLIEILMKKHLKLAKVLVRLFYFY